MSAVTIYLHIGATKTGSTALQRFLEQSFSKLLEFGILYPNFRSEDISTPMQPGQNYWHGYYFEETDGSGDLELFKKCIQYCREHSLHSIVISNDDFLIRWPDRIGQLAGKLDANIKIICYVRRQDHYFEAAWKQWGHKFVAANDLFASLEDPQYVNWFSANFMDWHKAIAPWAKNFGIENLIVWPYEKEQMPEGILPDFLNKINVVWPEKPVINSTSNDGARANIGFSRDVIEFLYFNREIRDSVGNLADAQIYAMVNTGLSDNFRKKTFDSYGILPPKDRISLLEKFETSNQLLAHEALGRADGRLFYEPWPAPDENWEPYEGLSVEKLTPILTKLIYNVYERQIALDKQYKQLDQLVQQQQAFRATYLASGWPRLRTFLSKLLRFLHLRK